jgi:hypothetical protein
MRMIQIEFAKLAKRQHGLSRVTRWGKESFTESILEIKFNSIPALED